MMESILPSLTENYQKVSPMGSTQRAQKALTELHNSPKTIESTEQLMVGCMRNARRMIFLTVLQSGLFLRGRNVHSFKMGLIHRVLNLM